MGLDFTKSNLGGSGLSLGGVGVKLLPPVPPRPKPMQTEEVLQPQVNIDKKLEDLKKKVL